MVIKFAKAAEEYNDIFKDDHDLVVFIRRNIEFNPSSVNDFVEYEKQCGFNDMQIAYLRELLLFISQNGHFNKADLLREELNFNGIFNSTEIGKLINDIENRM